MDYLDQDMADAARVHFRLIELGILPSEAPHSNLYRPDTPLVNLARRVWGHRLGVVTPAIIALFREAARVCRPGQIIRALTVLRQPAPTPSHISMGVE